MSNKQEILKKAIQKAIDGGWKIPSELTYISSEEFLIYLTTSSLTDLKWLKFKTNELIFNHDFAKALWGERLPDVDWVTTDRSRGWFGIADGISGYAAYDGPAWEYHLQQMVIADDPIKYLGENI